MRSERKFQRGSATVVAVLMIGVGLAAGISTMAAKEFARTQIAAKRDAKGSASNKYFLNLLSERFRSTEVERPLWFPNPYPTALEMAEGKVPFVGVVQPADRNLIPMVPTSEVAPQFEVDKTRLGSIVTKAITDPLGRTTYLQVGFLAAGDLSQVNTEWASFFQNPNTLWPMKADQTFNYTQTAIVSFLRVNADPTKPYFAKEILVNISTNNSGRSVTNTAKIALDAPPVPNCQLRLAPGYTLPLARGSVANVEIVTNSIVSQVQISGDDFVTFQNLTHFPNQSISNVGNYVPQATQATFGVPMQPYPGTPFTLNGASGVGWTIRANVYGVASAEPSYCELTVPVSMPLPPSCSMWASPSNPNFGTWTTVGMICNNPVTSVAINNQTVGFNQQTKYAGLDVQKSTRNGQVVTGFASGPGGTWNSTILLAPNCRFSDPEYIENIYMPWDEWRLFSHGPERNQQINYSRITLDVRYSFLTYIHTAETPCGANELCMFSEARWTGTDQFRGIAHLAYGPADSPNCELTRAYYRRPGEGCFVSGTKLTYADGSQRRIEKAKTGDLIWNPLTLRPVKIKKVTAGPELNPLWKFVTVSGEVRVTKDHPFFTERGSLPADQIRKGEKLFLHNGYETVLEVTQEKKSTKEWVWNIEVEGETERDHVVLANGVPSGDLWLQTELKRRSVEVLP